MNTQLMKNMKNLLGLLAMIALLAPATSALAEATPAPAAAQAQGARAADAPSDAEGARRSRSSSRSSSKSSRSSRSSSKSSSRSSSRRTSSRSTTVSRGPRRVSNVRPNTSRRTTTRRTTTTYRTSTPRRTTTTYRTTPRRTTTTYRTTPRRTTTTYRTTPRRTTVYHAPRRTTVYHTPAPSRTTVYHTHTTEPSRVYVQPRRVYRPRSRRTTVYYSDQRNSTYCNNCGTSVASSSPNQTRRDDDRGLEGYLTFGLGVGGFASDQAAPQPVTGGSVNVALGARAKFLAAELGLGVDGYSLDSAQSNGRLSLISTSFDLKLQPSLAFIEPYALVGAGASIFNDHIINEAAVGASLRLGGGLDLRFSDVAVGVRYLYAMHGFSDGAAYGRDRLSARSETISLGMTFYF